MKESKLSQGVLIAIEGIDGSGKTTLTKRLGDHFRQKGFAVSVFMEPTDGPYGQKIRRLAVHGRHTVTPEEELDLFMQDRIEDCELNLKPALDRHELVFIDRYYFSSIAYQGALGIDVQHILEWSEEIAIIPDRVLIIDIPVKLGLSRIQHLRGDAHTDFEKEEYLEEVRRIFLRMDAPYIRVVDGSREQDPVFDELESIVQETIAPYLDEHGAQPRMREERPTKGRLTFRHHGG